MQKILPLADKKFFPVGMACGGNGFIEAKNRHKKFSAWERLLLEWPCEPAWAVVHPLPHLFLNFQILSTHLANSFQSPSPFPSQNHPLPKLLTSFTWTLPYISGSFSVHPTHIFHLDTTQYSFSHTQLLVSMGSDQRFAGSRFSPEFSRVE